ncbi:unnamed protein product [Rhizophagus irregularis]|uniref:Uncharacterized protein n=1 Tax=Rhizophagus irregularis TaxID=588596 RepID=A0A915YT65_9GLOM|nr:unnamed protein product [Rhizophagus irregularis]
MYSEKIIPKMLMEPNCILLGKTSINDSFTVRVCDKNNINGIEVLFDQLKISGLKAREEKEEYGSRNNK